MRDVEGHRRASRSGRTYGGGGRLAPTGRRWPGGDRALRVAAGRDRIVERALELAQAVPQRRRGLGLKIGDDVRHNMFGEGVIIDMSGSGDKTEALVRFPTLGEKRLLLSWAPLERI